MDDAAGVARFVDAQGPVFGQVLAELRAGRKRSHWMWFVFPQLRGLGHSDMAWRYGIEDLAEARAYLAHPVLGPRLRECLRLVAAAPGDAEDVLGPVDARKLRSCATLVLAVAPDTAEARAVLERWWAGVPDPRTLALLGRATPPSDRRPDGR